MRFNWPNSSPSGSNEVLAMRQGTPETQTMKISDVKNQLSSLVNEIYRREKRILIEKAGIPVAALLSADDLALLEERDRRWEEGAQAMERMSVAFADVPVEELEAEIRRIIDENRRRDAEEAERRTA
jgi:prevent-host-death family protein